MPVICLQVTKLTVIVVGRISNPYKRWISELDNFTIIQTSPSVNVKGLTGVISKTQQKRDTKA